MNNIKNNGDVLDWAKTISDGKGEKYIPLGKADMYVIAKFVLAKAQCLHLVDENGEPKMSPPSPAEEPTDDCCKEPLKEPEVEHKESQPVAEAATPPAAAPKSLLGILKAKGINSAQDAYDAFLKATAKDEKARRVIDFSNGVMNVGPAFTWWVLGLLGEGGGNGL